MLTTERANKAVDQGTPRLYGELDNVAWGSPECWDASVWAGRMLEVKTEIFEMTLTVTAMPYRLGLDVGLSGFA